MGADEATTLDVLVGQREILGGLIATNGGRMAASRTSWLKRLVHMWVAAAVVLLVSIGETDAHPKFVDQPKMLVVDDASGLQDRPMVTRYNSGAGRQQFLGGLCSWKGSATEVRLLFGGYS